jgi:hypothetical protein
MVNNPTKSKIMLVIMAKNAAVLLPKAAKMARFQIAKGKLWHYPF